MDFDESLSGLYGAVLDDMTEFVHLCLDRMDSLYAHLNRVLLMPLVFIAVLLFVFSACVECVPGQPLCALKKFTA